MTKEQKKEAVSEVMATLKKWHILKDNVTATRTRRILKTFNSKAAMYKSLSAVFSGEENILTYNHAYMDPETKKDLKNAIDDKIQIFVDFEFIEKTRTNHRKTLTANIKKILSKCKTTMEIDIMTHDIMTGKIKIDDWVEQHLKVA